MKLIVANDMIRKRIEVLLNESHRGQGLQICESLCCFFTPLCPRCFCDGTAGFSFAVQSASGWTLLLCVLSRNRDCLRVLCAWTGRSLVLCLCCCWHLRIWGRTRVFLSSSLLRLYRVSKMCRPPGVISSWKSRTYTNRNYHSHEGPYSLAAEHSALLHAIPPMCWIFKRRLRLHFRIQAASVLAVPRD